MKEIKFCKACGKELVEVESDQYSEATGQLLVKMECPEIKYIRGNIKDASQKAADNIGNPAFGVYFLFAQLHENLIENHTTIYKEKDL